jgi:hypothetical protein
MAVSSIASLGADCRPSLRHGQFRAIEWPAGKQTGAKADGDKFILSLGKQNYFLHKIK